MLPRSSLSIRRLVSQRRPNAGENAEDCLEQDDVSRIKEYNKRQRTQSWVPNRSPSTMRRRKTPQEPLVIRHEQSLHQISNPLPPLPIRTSHSSSSDSLCPGDRRSDLPSRRGRRQPPLGSPRREDGKPTNPTPSTASSAIENTTTMSLEAQLKFEEAGGDFSDHPALRKTSITTSRDDDQVEQLSEQVQQLIRETDEAFKAVGCAIAEAKLMSHRTLSMHEKSPPILMPPPRASSLPCNVAQAGPIKRKPAPAPRSKPAQIAPVKTERVKTEPVRTEPARIEPARTEPARTEPVKHRPTPALPPMHSPTRTSSVTKARRRKSKSNRRSEQGRRARPVPKPVTRRTLSESMAGIFSGQFFKKIEADEMLTPDRIQALKVERESSEALRNSDTEGCDTPIEPFHLQDLPSRIGAAGMKTTLSPVEEASPRLPFEEPARPAFAIKRKEPGSPVKKTAGDEPMTVQSMTFPSPPLKNPARFLSQPPPARQPPPVPQLQRIPELLITPPEGSMSPTGLGPRSRPRPFVPVHDDDFVFFGSTPHTFNMPTFRHGPIRFPKSEVVKGKKIAPDDTMDWTAFQMAILGGAGYLYSEPPEFGQRSEAEEIDELVEWFDDFGFETAGELIPADGFKSSRPTTAEYSPVFSTSSTSSLSMDMDLPIPVEPEHPSGFWNDLGADEAKRFGTGCGIKRWTVEGHPKPYSRESLDSLSNNPMMDVLMVRSANGDYVSMGYNLGHDLGDFLKWEAEHVYAASWWNE